MTDADRELVELAAKAYGLDIADKDISKRWNPLKDDATAFQLLVDLNLKISGFEIITLQEIIGSNKITATRRAITRAAAEIGRGMKNAST